MNRYEYNKQSAGNGKKSYQTTRLPVIPKSSNDRFIFSREGDRLDQLAYDLYGDPRYWVLLANANKLGKGSLMVTPGLQLRLPAQSVLIEFSRTLRDAEENR
jgi:nucleoid-associated protein YgaU